MNTTSKQDQIDSAQLRFFFAQSVAELINLHPENASRWEFLVEKGGGILYHAGILQKVAEISPRADIESYCYLAVIDRDKKLQGWIIGYLTNIRYLAHYGRSGSNTLGRWLNKLLLSITTYFSAFPKEFILRDLIIGHDMD